MNPIMFFEPFREVRIQVEWLAEMRA